MEQKFIKRYPNMTILATKVELWLEQDSANLLKSFAEDLNVKPEDIIEYLLETLDTSGLPMEKIEDLWKLDGITFMGYNKLSNTTYKLVKVKNNENLPR